MQAVKIMDFKRSFYIMECNKGIIKWTMMQYWE